MPTDPKLPPPPVGLNTERWLESVQSVPSTTVAPTPSISTEETLQSVKSLHMGTDDSGVKEMVIREDNMKFSPSMKLERPKPETRRDGVSQKQL